MNHDVGIAIILHDFENLDLMCFEASSVAIDEETEKVKQFALVVAFLRLFFNIFADLLDELKDSHLVVKNCLVIIVHLF